MIFLFQGFHMTEDCIDETGLLCNLGGSRMLKGLDLSVNFDNLSSPSFLPYLRKWIQHYVYSLNDEMNETWVWIDNMFDDADFTNIGV